MDIKSLPWYGQLLIFVIIGLVFLGIYYNMYYTDGQTEINSLQDQKSQLESEIQKLQMKKREIAKIRKDIEIKEANLEKLQEILPNKKEIDKILRIIQERVKDCNLSILNFVPHVLMPKNITIKKRVTVRTGDRERTELRNTTVRNVYAEWPISLSLRGRYHDLAIFFVHLCSLSRIFTIDNFKITSYNKQNRGFTISANVEAKTYIFIEKENQKAGSKKVLIKRRG